MLKTTGVLILRNMSVKRIAEHYTKIGLTSIAEKLEVIVVQGDLIIRKLKEKYPVNESLINRISKDLLRQVNDYLLASERAISRAGKKVLEEFCETREVLPNFIDQRLWLLGYLGYSISSQNSPKG